MQGEDAHGPGRWAGPVCALAVAALAAGCARSDEAWRADLRGDDPFARAVAAMALSAQVERPGPEVVGALLEAVDRTDMDLERPARAALERMAARAPGELVAALLGDGFLTAERRSAVLSALTASGPAGAEAILAAVEGEGQALGGELGVVLVRMGPDAVGPLTARLGRADAPRMAGYSAFVLGRMGAPAVAALPALRAARSHPDAAVRAAVEQALRELETGPGARGPSSPAGGR